MADPMPEDAFDALMDRAGIPPDPASRANIRAGSVLLTKLTARLHAPRPVTTEPATVFVPGPNR